MTTLNFGAVEGLTETERQQLQDLAGVYNYHQSGNTVKNKYYEGHVTLNDVNLGIALPNGLRGMEIGCNWGQKAVDALADRSMFDGFVGSGAAAETMTQLVAGNRLLAEYAKACREELKYGCVFATLSADPALRCRIRFHSPATSAALWNGEKGRIDCGLAIIDTVPDEKFKGTWRPHIVNLYTDDAVLVLTAQNGVWTAERHAHRMGRPLMEPMIWNATSGKPFGRSRLKKAVRALIDDYIRIIANATIALEFDTTPQKYLLGLTDDQYDAVVSNKFKQYVGAILASTTNPETGENPQFGQLAQGSLQPHVDKMRMTATQFSAATGLTITDVGIINDANPTSSDAILAQSQTLVLMAQQLNTSNGDALRTIAQMAQAIVRNVPLDQLSDEERDVMPHFKNPAMPSVAVTADAAIKIASARKEFASTDTFLEMIGFNQADIRRIKAQEQRVRGQQLLVEVENENNGENLG
ncbi:MAG TPA: phage portal protein [Candidatus Gemmiger avistercoris]|uniref:Phage portal protein n=1 Tax=Candidatus Gemmiger avistercoris TaxID=2838606 RepID=A0A9D2FIY2_9FIRM|nr:phage portal protein [uncultured Subdoligranulum sp.]HIZ61407.1 phage portal protein [Candidatus Gemmiger avistercoris]